MKDFWTLAFSFIVIFLIMTLIWSLDYTLHNSLYNFINYPLIEEALTVKSSLYMIYLKYGYVFRIWIVIFFSAAIHLFGYYGKEKNPNYVIYSVIIIITGSIYIYGFTDYNFYDLIIVPFAFLILLYTLFKLISNLQNKPVILNENIFGCNTEERDDFINYKFNITYKRLKK
ncbi:MAG: hypothetical protein JKY54_03650 [Flavobacteriales bacterium]|nr:hypothetical protein [Flavobacteriales bacterium]